jgi:hypothetical protein
MCEMIIHFSRASTMVLVAWLVAIASPALAQATPRELTVVTDWGRIERLHSAWSEDAMGVHHGAPFVNSRRVDVITRSVVDECKTVTEGYATDVSDPARKLHHALLIGAFLHLKEVRFVLQGCSFDRPRIISVEMR